MPIRAENKDKYPKNWKKISDRIRRSAGQRCECNGECGTHQTPCRALNKKPHPVTRSTVVLTVAHLNHDPADCRRINLKAMCQKCHNAYDAPMRARGIKERARATRAMGDLFETEKTRQ